MNSFTPKNFSETSRMILDLVSELERRSRGGKAFSIILLCLNEHCSPEILLKSFQSVTRIFDDIYVYNERRNEYLLSLKHCDTKGAFRFITRLKNAIKKEDVFQNPFEAVVAEPVEGDDIPKLLKLVEEDLEKILKEGSGEMGEYKDISPLKRYVDQLKK